MNLDYRFSTTSAAMGDLREGSWRVKKGRFIKNKLPGIFGSLNSSDLSDYKNTLFMI